MSSEEVVEMGTVPVSEHESVAASNNAASRLATLPEELLSNISIKLGSDDIFALRLTCRDVEAKVSICVCDENSFWPTHANNLQTFHEFATEYFTAKCFIFTTESLNVLVRISKHHKLREYLTKLYFAPAQMSRLKPTCDHGHPIRSTVRQREALDIYMADQKQLQASGGDKQLLVEALNNLPAVRLVSLVDHLGGLPEGVECRGLQKVTRTTGNRPPLTGSVPALVPRGMPTTNRPNYTWLSHVWTTLLYALAESGTSTVTRLETDLASGLSPLTDLKFKKDLLPLVTNALSHIQELDLQIRGHTMRKSHTDVPDDCDRACRALKTLSLGLTKVTTVKLSFDSDPGFPMGNLFKAFMSKVDIGKLTKFHVDTVSVDMKFLAGMVCKLKSIQTLSFSNVGIDSGGSWVPILKAIAKLPALTHLHLMYLTEAGGRVYFLEQPPPATDSMWDASAGLFGHGAGAGNDEQWTEDDDTSDSDDELPLLVPDGVMVDEPILAEPGPTGLTTPAIERL